MKFFEYVWDGFLEFGSPLAALAVSVVVLVLAHRWLQRWSLVAERKVRHQSIMLSLTALAILVFVLMLPIGDSLKGQILSFVAILLSATIALSSTTFLGNALAGLMLRSVKSYRIGDFIRVQDSFGRVSERGLFHTEIQTEDRDLVTIPNLYLVTHPVTTIRSSGTIVSATVSLGYDVPRLRIKELLTSAAESAELEEPFVQVMELGDFSVTYRVAGLLKEVKHLISVRSNLRGKMLDALHEGGVEIVSPTFMNTRAFEIDSRFIPRRERSESPQEVASPEKIVFDKADDAESLEALRSAQGEIKTRLQEIEKELKGAKDDDSKEQLTAKQQTLEQRQERLAKAIEQSEERGEAK